MFTPDQRARLRQKLLSDAQTDGRIQSAAITGSAAGDHEDLWSDIDLAFAITPGHDAASLLHDWTTKMYARHGAVHHVDLAFGAWRYRSFLLDTTLQVDLAFAPASDFRPLAPTFQLVFGDAQSERNPPPPEASYLAGMAWLHLLHARSSIARGQLWQAEYMISGARDHALMLACLRHGLPTAHGRGLHDLPGEVLHPFEPALVRSLDPRELTRAFHAVREALCQELSHWSAELACLRNTIAGIS